MDLRGVHRVTRPVLFSESQIKDGLSVMIKWEVRRDNETLSWGTSEASFPDAKARKMFRSDGYKIYVDGKLYKE